MSARRKDGRRDGTFRKHNAVASPRERRELPFEVRTFTSTGRAIDSAWAETPGEACCAAAVLLREASEHGAGAPTVSFLDADGLLIAGGLRRVDVPKEVWS